MVSQDFQALVAHYRADHRDLPWRRTRDPYRILVSELMLQQTRVETVLRFYDRFLERFPTAAALAEAPEEDVLTAWAGLGYYRRARLLQAAARAAAGGFPTEEALLRELPGLGEYTAAAVASIAFERPAVALDGNAIRVLARYFGERGDPSKAATRQRLRERTLPHIPAGAAGDFTQAVMELGATLCSPRNPRCLLCPLADCRAKKDGTQTLIPPPKPQKAPVAVERHVVRVEQAGSTLLIREPDSPFLADFWQCPHFPDREAASQHFGELQPLGEVKHGITFRRLTLHVYRAGPPVAELPWSEQRWVASPPANLPLPAFMGRIYSLEVASR